MSLDTFEAFPKFTRFEKITAHITEKLDGTNAAIAFNADGDLLAVQSRKRLITPGKSTDNYGFAGWVNDNTERLFTLLGPGRHYGEWWGQGIQRNYGLDHRVFSLFAEHIFGNTIGTLGGWVGDHRIAVVPKIATTTLDRLGVVLANEQWQMEVDGSRAAPGFMDPEGVMIHLTPIGVTIKHPFEGGHKGGPRDVDGNVIQFPAQARLTAA